MAYYPNYMNPYMTVYPAQNAFMVNPTNNPMWTTPTTQTGATMQMPNSQSVTMNQPGLFNWVKSEKEVETQYVAPNGVVTFWNENEPVIYLKQADATGKSTIRTFDLVERTDKPVTEEKTPVYATKEDVNAFSDVIADLRKDLETIKGDVYGLAGKKRIVRKADGEIDE